MTGGTIIVEGGFKYIRLDASKLMSFQ
jgi:hypothetical protein